MLINILLTDVFLFNFITNTLNIYHFCEDFLTKMSISLLYQ